MVTEINGEVKTTVKIPRDVWLAAKHRALADRSDFRAVVVNALRSHLGLKTPKPAKKGGGGNVR